MPTTIQVSGRRFLTDPATWVGESAFFKALFSGQWDGPQDDGSYFIDADPDLFEHILRYLRRGVLPVFYDRTKGHDYMLYGALLEEARFFGIDRLEKWLDEQKYLEVVKVAYSVTETDNLNKLVMTVDGSVEITYDLVKKRGTVWYCPEGRYGHYSEQDCRICTIGKENGGYRYEDQMRWTVTQKRTTFNHQLCIQGR
jgi:hypothetical protein